MSRKNEIDPLNVFEYLKAKYKHSMEASYFLADENSHKGSGNSYPVRTFTYAIGLNYYNSGDFRIGSNQFKVKEGSLITIGPGIVCHWLSEFNTKHDTIYFTDELLKNMLKGSALKMFPFFMPGGNHVIDLRAEEAEQLKTLFNTMKQFTGDEEVVAGIVYSMLTLVSRYHKQQPGKTQSSNAERIAGNFRSLLSKYFLQSKEVGFYAGELNITPKYLSEVLLNETGKTAKTLIDEHVFLEAKSLLRQTTMSVQEICHWLGYEDTSYFTKAFKKQENLTPLAYRRL